MTSRTTRVGGSFRDPSGFVFICNGKLHRQVNLAYRSDYDKLMTSGLYAELVANGWLVHHVESTQKPAVPEDAYKVITPTPIPFISYPYEWSYSQLKDAGLLTLQIARAALNKGMLLKDANAYNIQFVNGKPILIDTLSFLTYKEGTPWEAYRQFCQHFIAPLALASLVDIRLIQLMRVYIDGIPLDLAGKLLPAKTRLGLSGLALHIHLHAKAQRYFASTPQVVTSGKGLSKTALIKLFNGLEKTLQTLVWEPKGTEWGNYYNATNYSGEALKVKGEIIRGFIEHISPRTALDLGANNGFFSREASRRGVETIACDIDPEAVEQNYRLVKQLGEEKLLPLVIDLTNPSGSMGWANAERDSLMQRGPLDLIIALALIHHLVIANNVPMPFVVNFLAAMGKWAIVEFVPREDSQVKRLLASRKDIFENYDVRGFEEAFRSAFTIEGREQIPESGRILYLFKRK